MVIASAYGKNAAARIEFRDGKVWLALAPAAQSSQGNGRRYDWTQKKNFNLDRSELHAMKVVMDTALRRDIATAQALCNSLLNKDNCLFIHVAPQGQAIGGLSLHTEDKGGIYAPFTFRISYYSKSSPGKEDVIQVGMTRVNAMMIIRDIEVFNTEYVQYMARLEMADTMARERQPGSPRGEENNDRGFDQFPGDLP